MKKPDDIPQRVWDEAGAIHSRRSYREHISRAILAAEQREREACALIADAVIDRDGSMMFIQGVGWTGLRQVVTAAIRTQEPS